MDEDIYSLAFVSSLSDEQITPYFDVITGELKNLSDSEEEESKKEEEKTEEPKLNSLLSLRARRATEE